MKRAQSIVLLSLLIFVTQLPASTSIAATPKICKIPSTSIKISKPKIASLPKQVKSPYRVAIVPLLFKDTTSDAIAKFPTGLDIQRQILDKDSFVQSWLKDQSFGRFVLVGEVFNTVSINQNFLYPNGETLQPEDLIDVKFSKPPQGYVTTCTNIPPKVSVN